MDRLVANDLEMAGEGSKGNDNGLELQQRAGNEKADQERRNIKKRNYLKEAKEKLKWKI